MYNLLRIFGFIIALLLFFTVKKIEFYSWGNPCAGEPLRGWCQKSHTSGMYIQVATQNGEIILELDSLLKNNFSEIFFRKKHIINNNFCILNSNLDINTESSLFCLDSAIWKSSLIENLKFVLDIEQNRTNIIPTTFKILDKSVVLSGTFVSITLNATAYCKLIGLGGLQGRGKNCCQSEQMTLIFPLRIEDSSAVYFDTPLHK